MGEASFKDMLSPAAQLSATYNFHHAMGVRIGLGGWQGKGCVVVEEGIYRYNFVQLNADYVFDIRKMKKGDTLITTEISRISRSLTDIMSVMGQCLERGINILTTKEKYRFDGSINSKVLCFAFGLVAEIEHNLISMRTKEALAARKAEGKPLGRKKGNTPKTDILRNQASIISDMKNNGASDKEIYMALGVSKSTYYKYRSKAMSEEITSEACQ
jgi:DNA invertase Pin-like site-specific DNA recombinase